MHPVGSRGDKSTAVADDDAAEGAAHRDQPKGGERGKKKEKSRGQNTNRNFGASRDEVGLCASRANSPELSPGECRFGGNCKFEHDLRKYLKDWKREDLTTFGGVCPIWYVYLGSKVTYVIHIKPCPRSKKPDVSPKFVSQEGDLRSWRTVLREKGSDHPLEAVSSQAVSNEQVLTSSFS